MDKSKQREYESVINSQKEQLTRYETRLKDVVTAYKGLLKEKEALEASFKAVNNAKETSDSDHAASDNDLPKAQSKGNSEMQIATLMNSLATLSAEKSRMEASFQGDKKQLRQELFAKDKIIRDLQEKLKHTITTSQLEMENARSKIIVERHDREKEHNDHMVMVKELQKLLADERHLKENLEMQLNDLKTQFTSTSQSDRAIKELSNELEATKKKLKNNESSRNQMRDKESTAILHQLQSEMTTLKQNHAVAIKNEQKRAYQAEDRYKKLSSIHEERVANLESRLAELSSTVGNYDRLRQQDQENIFKLKEKIAQMSIPETSLQETVAHSLSNMENEKSVDEMITEFEELKRLILTINMKLDQPRDLSKLFSASNDHSSCLDDVNKYRNKFEKLNEENIELTKIIENQKNHIKTLQEKVIVLNRNIDEQETEIKSRMVESNHEIKAEKAKWKEIINAMETDFRGKVAQLELSLQKQRDRSLTLLEEKENEIKALKTSFEVFMPQDIPLHHDTFGEDGSVIEKSAKKISTAHLSSVLTSNVGSAGVGPNAEHHHMLHYVHELARKDVEVSQLRKAKHSAETALRQALQNKVASQEELHLKINSLEEQVDRLQRNQSRKGENLEYLKNVILSFLITTDAERKRHMLNAIGAVLKFNPNEIKQITRLFFKKAK